VPVLAGNSNRLDQAFVVTPDGVRVEILEDKTQTIPTRGRVLDHIGLDVKDLPTTESGVEEWIFILTASRSPEPSCF
jgi:hypothetical protein